MLCFLDICRLNNIVNFFSSNLCGNLLTFIGIIVTVIVAYKTIKNVNENTNIQLKENNKQLYRPFINISSINAIDYFDWNNIVLDCKGSNFFREKREERIKKDKSSIKLEMKIENIGNGIANKVKFINIDEKNKIKIKESEEYDITTLEVNNIVIKKDEEKIIQLELNYLIDRTGKETSDYIQFYIQFEDINGNKYKTKITIEVYPKDLDRIVSYSVYSAEEIGE